jgi:hypothetical protein
MAKPLPNKINLIGNKVAVTEQMVAGLRYILYGWRGKWYFGASGRYLRNQFLHTLCLFNQP